MRKYLPLLICVLFLLSCRKDDASSEAADTPDIVAAVYGFEDGDIVQGRMRVKLKEEPAAGVAVRSTGGTVTTGVRALDGTATVIGITRMERTFPHAGRFEERSRREGLHLWYDVWFSESVSAARAVGETMVIEGIEIAVPVMKVVSTAMADQPHSHISRAVTRYGELPFNDPYLSLQWSYNNTGSEQWQRAGADIRLYDVWHEYNGHPDIIVAIVDGGIALDNPDLRENLWVNPGEIAGNGQDDDGNGYVDDVYGYNFVSNSGTVSPQRHGTHVAGTIGAVNNNGTGVSGIAGGDGTPGSGVKLMSCQIFEHPPGSYYSDIVADNIAAAIKYGADNGAVISQNSWGYAADTRQASYIDPTHKAAIDYFVKYAGCDNDGKQLPGSPMKGGIVLFASGNSSSESARVAAPADYYNVLGIAAVGPDYLKAPYSNYGTYMDLSAPGGLGNTETGIYSTTIAELDYYEYRYGTSMSCPHVAGVAALVIQKHGVGRQGFTALQLEEILLTTAYDIDRYNPTYAGKLGAGCVDAAAALAAELPDGQSFTVRNNPVTDGILRFRVNSDLAGTGKVTVRNGAGAKVLEHEIETVRYKYHELDISSLSSGTYSLEYSVSDRSVKERFIKN